LIVIFYYHVTFYNLNNKAYHKCEPPAVSSQSLLLSRD